MKKAVIVLASLAGVALVIYPLLVWVYCILDDYVLRPDGGKWHFAHGAFWHSYKLRPRSDDAVYDWLIDLFGQARDEPEIVIPILKKG